MKILLYSIKFEQMVLSSLILNNNFFYKFKNELKLNDFFFLKHKIIFKEILNFVKNNFKFDINFLSNQINKNFNINIYDYLKFIIQLTPSPSNLNNYIYVLKKFSILRTLLINSKKFIVNIFKNKNIDLDKFLKKLEFKIFNVNKNYLNNSINEFLIKNNFKNFIKKIKINLKNPNKSNILLTGFYKLDNLISGISFNDLIIIAGRPSMGKTTFAINIAINISIESNLSVLIFSMEMSNIQLINRILSSISNLDQILIKNFNLSKIYFKKLKSVIKKIYNYKIFIDESSSISPLDVYLKSKKLIQYYGKMGIIIIDYLQLMSSDNINQNRVLEISDILRSLKSISKDLSVPIIVISQLNRSLELRNNKKPMMSDLRESGSIEQDSDLILFLYRDEVYNKNSSFNNEAEIIISKQRNGPLGSIFLNFSKNSLKFNNI